MVNASLNPILYYCRMKRFRTWCNHVINCKSFRPDELSESYTRRFTQMQGSKASSRLQMVCSAVKVVKHLRIESKENEHYNSIVGAQCFRLGEEEKGLPPVVGDNHVVSVL